MAVLEAAVKIFRTHREREKRRIRTDPREIISSALGLAKDKRAPKIY